MFTSNLFQKFKSKGWIMLLDAMVDNTRYMLLHNPEYGSNIVIKNDAEIYPMTAKMFTAFIERMIRRKALG